MNSNKHKKKKSESIEGLIVKIQRYSIHDGPGIRTTVFFKGCPLRCQWCHSPETQNSYTEIGFYEDKCIKECKECVSICPEGAISENEAKIQIDREKCTNCGECEKACPSGALTTIGYYISPAELKDEIKRDRQFYETSGGGITLSGGEPLYQHEFAREIAKKCRQEGISVALDTCGFTKKGPLKDVLEYVDMVLFDLKHMDTTKHIKYTGVNNEVILENAAMINKSGLPIILRFPLIPGINDSRENLEYLARYAKGLDSVKRLDILPYHSMGLLKYRMIDRTCKLQDLEMPDKNRLNEVRDLLQNYGLEVSVLI
ncbi:MAG: glycyl-radical enzyme activating protein [Desulfobacteraceae bacterium]|nr:glycyl-radical enzyme activating protein [Desulfobacteraceae bacterium]